MKKLLIVGLIVSLLMVGVVAPASADWEVVKTRGFTVKTGSIGIDVSYWNVVIDNMRPGSTADVTFTVTNSGTCPVALDITVAGKPDWLTVEVDSPSIASIGSGGSTDITITLTMRPDIYDQDYMNQKATLTVTFTATSVLY